MYSYEIQTYLQQRNYLLTSLEYLFITDTKLSPQIAVIKNNFDDTFYLATKDGCEWTIKLKNEKEIYI